MMVSMEPTLMLVVTVTTTSDEPPPLGHAYFEVIVND